MPDLGIGEALAAFGGGDLLASLFGGGAAAAEGAGAVAAPAFGAAETAATGLTAGELGAASVLPGFDTATAFLSAPTFDALGGTAAAGTGGITSGIPGLSTAASWLAAPSTDILAGVGTGADLLGTGAGAALGPGGLSADGSLGLLSGQANPEAIFGGSDVTGSGVTGTAISPSATSTGVTASATPAAPGATAFSPAAGLNVPGAGVDATSAAATAPGSTAGLPSGFPGTGAAATGVPAAGTAATPAASSGLSLDSLIKGAETSLTKNPLGIGLGAAGLGYSVLSANKQSDATKAIAGQAAAQGQLGAQLASYLQTGTLPPGLKSSVDQATAAAKAAAISNAASQGLPTDPTHNTALAETLAGIDQKALATVSQIGQQLLNAGVSESGMANQLYQSLQQIDQTQTNNIGKSIAAMAAALNTGGTKIQIGGTSA